MSDVRRVAVAELRGLIADPVELAKGAQLADRGGLFHLARHGNKLFADAAGSGATPYKAQLVFTDTTITGRCSCFAARSRPYCKHAAALLVAWARTPEAFVVATTPPPTPGERKRSSVRAAKIDATAARTKGIDQASTVLLELWQTGTQALAADRAQQVADLATSLRELGLRRLSVRMLELGELLELAAHRDGTFPEEAYAALVADMWLTVRKLEKHLSGEALQPEHVEELIGKTWTKKDRPPVEGLELFEYAFLHRVTADDFVLRESRFFDVASGEHYSEKQILPALIAKRTPPKPARSGQYHSGVSGTAYPTFSPRRIEVVDCGNSRPLDGATLDRAVARALPSASAVLAALAERRRDVFAPPWIPVLVRIDWVVPIGGRLCIADPEGSALYLSGGRAAEDALVSALTGMEALALFGDVALEGAAACLLPLAVIGRRDGATVLVPLGGMDATEALETRIRGDRAGGTRVGPDRMATLLGEVRKDLAAGFVAGTNGISHRYLEPLAARLTELSLTKQADALRAVGNSADPTERLDGLVKLWQVLGIALTRLVGTAKLDLSTLVRIPTLPTVAIPRPGTVLSAVDAVSQEAVGLLNCYERAYHIAVYYQSCPPEALLANVEVWGDGWAIPFVVRAAQAHPNSAVDAALSILLAPLEGRTRSWSRLALLTALSIVAESPKLEARRALVRVASHRTHPASARAQRILNGPRLSLDELNAARSAVISGPNKNVRVAAIESLAAAEMVEAIREIRTALRDPVAGVRKAAAHALGLLGDVDSLETFVSWLDDDHGETASAGAHALGALGDTRAAAPLLRALARGQPHPPAVADALVQLGPWVMGPLLDVLLTKPELAKRAAVSSMVKDLPLESTLPAMIQWVERAPDVPAQIARVRLASGLAGSRGEMKRV